MIFVATEIPSFRKTSLDFLFHFPCKVFIIIMSSYLNMSTEPFGKCPQSSSSLLLLLLLRQDEEAAVLWGRGSSEHLCQDSALSSPLVT